MKQLSIQMTKGERITGVVYLPFYLILNGIIIQFVMDALGLEATELKINLVYFYVNFVFVVVAFRKFLSASLLAFFKSIGRSIKGTLLGFAVYMGLSVVVGVIIMSTSGMVSNPNNDYVSSLYDQSSKIITVGAVLLGPIAEEALFRGVIFGWARKKSRLLAYALSFICFAFIHVWAYAAVSPDWTILINVLQYLAPTIALCFAYEKGDNIFCAILLHMAVNAFAVSAMSAGLLG